jgi:hypothetical protein
LLGMVNTHALYMPTQSVYTMCMQCVHAFDPFVCL